MLGAHPEAVTDRSTSSSRMDREMNDAIELAYEGEYEHAGVFVVNNANVRPHEAKRVADAVFFSWNAAVRALPKRALREWREERKFQAPSLWDSYLGVSIRLDAVADLVELVVDNAYFENKAAVLAEIAGRLGHGEEGERAMQAFPIFERAESLAKDKAA